MRKERKIISSLLIFSILLSIFIPIISNSYTIDEGVRFSLSSDATQLVEGTQITVSMYIELESGKSVDTFSGFLKYDTSVLEFNTDEEFLTSTQTKWNNPDYVDNNGRIQIESTRSNSNSAKSGLMYTMVFNVLKTTESTEISLEEPINCAYLGVDIWCEGMTLKIPDVPEVYTITYNANTTDNVNNMPSVGNKVQGIDYTIATTPIRTGYTFTGWNTKADGTGTTYEAGSTYTIDADLELYAQWQIITTTLTVNPNGGVWESSSVAQTFTQGYGTTKLINDPSTAPNGYMVKFNANGGQADFLQTTQTTTFDKWTLIGGGTLDGKTYTFSDTTATLTANYKGNSITLPNATKTGATFKGWYTTSTGGTKIGGAGEEYIPESNITLFAQWNEIEYTLTINPDGGIYNGNTTVTGGYESTVAVTNPTAPNGYTITLNKNDGTETTTQLIQTKTFDKWILTGKGSLNGIIYTFGDGDGQLTATYTANSVEIETPTREGYTFDGWYTQPTGGTQVEIPYVPTSDITLYAHWTAKTYKITFNPGTDGTVDPLSKTVTYDEPYGTLPIPTIPGYTFKEWIDQNGNPISETDTVNITNDTTLTATWEGDTYTLTINPNGGTYPGNLTKQGAYKDTITVDNPTGPDGYTVKLNDNGNETQVVQTTTFTGWTVTLGDGQINGTTYTFGTQDGEIIANYKENTVQLPELTKTGYNFDGWYTQPTGGTQVETTYMPTSDITLYAHWTANTYKITFNPGTDGTVEPSSKTVTYDEPYGTLPTPNRPGYDFGGWEDINGNPVTETDMVKITEDTTLIATWLGAEYKVTFDPDGGEVNPTSKQVRNEGKYGELPLPTKTGYTFKGWYNTNEQKIENTTIVNLVEDEILIAKWEPNTYTITFDPGENAVVDESTREVKYGDTYGTLPLPTKPGYVFDGWYGPDGNKIEENDIIDILTDITVTAEWTGEKYTLTFDYDGGTGNETSRTIQNGLAYGTLPIANKTGYTFKGWFNSNGQEVKGTEIVNTTSNVTLYAKYDINKYKVTFKNDDGSIITIIDVEYGKNAQYTGNTPVKSNVQAGYEATFNGWEDASKLSNVTEDVTVIATYTISPKVYTITYNNLKDSDNSANPTTYTIEDPDITLVDLPNQGKYIFKGWYTTNDETGIKVTSIDTSKLGNIILHAQWENDSLYFKSEKYKVGENDIDNYENGDVYLDKIEPETNLDELIENCDTNGTITVIDEKGQTLSSGDLVGTNMTIKVTRYDEEITMTIVVMGDIDGDGKATTQDLSELNKAYLGISEVELTGTRFKAADIDDSKRITATDFSELNKASLGISKLTYNKPNKK